MFTASNCGVRLNNVIVSPPVISGPNIATSFLSFVITLKNYDRSTKYRQDSANIRVISSNDVVIMFHPVMALVFRPVRLVCYVYTDRRK